MNDFEMEMWPPEDSVAPPEPQHSILLVQKDMEHLHPAKITKIFLLFSRSSKINSAY